MSSRHRHTSRAPAAPVYPTPEEREAIIERREELFQKLTVLLVGHHGPGDPAFDRVVRQYGHGEVQRQLSMVQTQAAERDFLIDEPLIYRKYRQIFARFGGSRRFLKRAEYETLSYEHMNLMARRRFLSSPPIAPPGPREKELNDLLLVAADFWDDITPPAVPPCPASWSVPQPEPYARPAASLLAWGWRPTLASIRTEAKDVERWNPVIPDLIRMVFDPGVLDGWPGASASWAAYHALHLLGALQVHSSAARLLTLAERENDWLSDCLPAVWALMGKAVEPILWNLLDDAHYSDDQFGLVVYALNLLIPTCPERREAIISGLVERLSDPARTNPTVNAYIVFVLNRLNASSARKAIVKAFKQDRVNTRIMRLEDISL